MTEAEQQQYELALRITRRYQGVKPMTEQQQYELALLSLWYHRAQRRNDIIGMASYHRRIVAIYKMIYPWYTVKVSE